MLWFSSFVSFSSSAVLPQLEYLCGSREIAHKVEDKKTQKANIFAGQCSLKHSYYSYVLEFDVDSTFLFAV